MPDLTRGIMIWGNFIRVSAQSMEQIDKCIAVVNENWEDFRKGINEGRFLPEDTDLALNHIFLKTFNDLFTECENVAGLTKKLGVVNSKYRIMRGTKISVDEYGGNIEYSRLLPQKEYIKNDNRFSPKGVEWLYLAISDDPLLAKECCIQECRAKKNDKFALVSFEISDKYCGGEVVDLTVGTEYGYTELENRFKASILNNNEKMIQKALGNVPNKVKQMRASKKNKYLGKLYKRFKKKSYKNSLADTECILKFFTLAYSKLISENIFEPVETDKSEKYAPFHCLANYFISKGYIGIIYSSTVCKKGKNIVLFDKNYASPTGSIDKFIV